MKRLYNNVKYKKTAGVLQNTGRFCVKSFR